MATMIQNAMKNLWMMGVFLSYSLCSQIPAGTDAQHATVILLNTDSVYSQNRSQGWFSFTTSSVSSVSGNVINLKTVVIRDPVSSTMVKIKVVNLYDSGLNLLVSDTLHSGDTSLVFTASVSANQSYYIQTIANYPCDSCVYNEAVSFKMSINPEVLIEICGIGVNIAIPTNTVLGQSDNIMCSCSSEIYTQPCDFAIATCNNSSITIGVGDSCEQSTFVVQTSLGTTYTISNVSSPYAFTPLSASVAVTYTICGFCYDPEGIGAGCGCFTLTVLPQPNASFSVTSSCCVSNSTYIPSSVQENMGVNASIVTQCSVCLLPDISDSSSIDYFNHEWTITGGTTNISYTSTTIPCFTLAPGTYTVQHTVYLVDTSSLCYSQGVYYNFSCYDVSSQVITISAPPVVYASASSNTVCANSSVTLTASGANSYTWQPGSIVGNPIVVTPSVSTIYTVTGSVSNCSAQATVGVNVVACNSCTSCPVILSGTLSSSPASGQSYCVTSDIYIFSPITFSGSEFRMSKNVKIVVGNGGLLSIDNSHLYACDSMWRGIVVYDPVLNTASNGKVTVYNNSLIEDAHCAISYPYGSNVISGLLNALSTNGAVFNKNDTSIVIRNHQVCGGGASNPYKFSIQNTVFTSRKIPYNTTFPYVPVLAYASNVKAMASNAGVPLASPYINNAIYPYSTTKEGKYPQMGIFLMNVGVTTGSSLPFSYCEIKIGNNGVPNFNVFDNLQIGIGAINSNFTCVNNVFQNAAPIGKGGAVGRGIYAGVVSPGQSLPMNARIRVIPGTPTGLFNNQFYDLSRAIETVNYFEHDIRNCSIRSTQVDPSPLPSVSFHKGEYGVLMQTNRYYSINVTNNSLYNVENGIVFNAIYGKMSIPGVVPLATNAQYSGKVDISNNVIQPHLSGYGVTTQYVSNAIYVANTMPFGTSYINSSLDINVNGNNIKDAYRGIYIANFQKKRVNSISNCIGLKTQASLLPNPIQFGIYRVNLTGSALLNNDVLNNDVTGGNMSNPNMIGIHIKQSVNEKVSCNTVSNVYYGIMFDGVSSPCGFLGNKMNNYAVGFAISNGAVIGPQGSSTAPSDNVWLGSCFFKIEASTASTILSPLYVRGSPAIFNPNGCVTPSGSYDFSNNSLIPSSGPVYSCPNVNACGSGIPTPLVSAPAGSVNAVQLMEKIVQNQLPMSTSEKWLSKHHIYRALESDVATRNSSSVLSGFYTLQQGSNYQAIMDIEADIYANQLFSAQAKLSALTPSNNIESNVKQYYQIYLNYLNGGSLSGADSSALYTLSAGCPHTDGVVVHLARAMYNAVYQKILWWEDNCVWNAGEGNKTLGSREVDNSATNSDMRVKVYPNPSNGVVVVECIGCEISRIEVLDISGKKVFERIIKEELGYIKVELSLHKGTYIMNVTEKGGLMSSQKIMVE